MEDAGDLHDNLAAADRAGTVAFIAFFRASPAVSILESCRCLQRPWR
jgi:hypothetical protein